MIRKWLLNNEAPRAPQGVLAELAISPSQGHHQHYYKIFVNAGFEDIYRIPLLLI